MNFKYYKLFLARFTEKLRVSSSVVKVIIHASDIDTAEHLARGIYKRNKDRYDEFSVTELPVLKANDMLFIPDNVIEEPFLTLK